MSSVTHCLLAKVDESHGFCTSALQITVEKKKRLHAMLCVRNHVICNKIHKALTAATFAKSVESLLLYTYGIGATIVIRYIWPLPRCLHIQ
jgi:hypothetical protein